MPSNSNGETGAADAAPAGKTDPRAWLALAALFVGYIGVYLCRKNLATATPLLTDAFGVSNAVIGRIASAGTLAYAIGKFIAGPLIDRFGGRTGFLTSLSLVAVFTALGGVAPGVSALIVIYSANRLSGAAGWGSMVKLAASWFPPKIAARAISVLCLSYVIGGAAAAWVAGEIAQLTHNNWRLILGLPALFLGIWTLVLARLLRLPKKTVQRSGVEPGKASTKRRSFEWSKLPGLFATPAFLALIGLSFTTTLGREFFADWGVKFMQTECGLTVADASKYSSAFDLGGVLGIFGIGWIYGRLSEFGLRWLLVAALAGLGAILWTASTAHVHSPIIGLAVLGGSGLLLYGPYSLLSGALALDVRGPEYAATVACLVDAAGYFAGAYAGAGFGAIIDHGGYAEAFSTLALLMAASAVISLFVSRPARLLPNTK